MKSHSFLCSAMRMLIVVFILSLFSASVLAKEPSYVYSEAADGKVCIYDSPSTNGGLLGYLVTGGKGALFKGKLGKWDKVNFYGQTGYVASDQVRLGNANLNGKKPHATSGRENLVRKGQTVYYVVGGSYKNRESAIKQAQTLSEVVFYNVYEATVKGKKTYRLCCGAYTDKKSAQDCLNMVKRHFNGNVWIWRNKGLAKCVYISPSPVDDEDEVVDFPFTPQD